MQNLSALRFGVHLHWPQGPRKPALLTFGGDETKNGVALDFEIPTALADRLHVYRNEIAPAVIGKRPEAVFVTFTGKPRTQAAISLAIKKSILRHLGVRMSPHQFRHLLAQMELDDKPGAYEHVRQMLAHRNLKTTVSRYAGVNTRRAGRAHAALLETLREPKLGRRPNRRKSRP
jgi:integrase